MGCAGCTVSTGGAPKGCGSKGNCATGGCNRLNTFDWLSKLDLADTDPFGIVEVSFKNGAHKSFFQTQEHHRNITGDLVVVETDNGYDIGAVSLTGELVRMQMKKKKVKDSEVIHKVLRRANERDLERLDEARQLEKPTMIRARAIARTLSLDMKIGDVEYQADKRKATFYYTADGRVDFRELIRHYAREFRVKIEMRQIGARQESARIGGIGSCGRELCCSTWLSDFKSVSTAAARYQNLAINQSKLSGQCGRLKCCLNYELDTYLEALDAFPEGSDKLRTQVGTAVLIKTDIFKKIMYYAYEHEKGRGKVYPLAIDHVKEVLELNAKGEKPAEFAKVESELLYQESRDEEVFDFEDVTGAIELPEEKRNKRRNNRKKKRGPRSGSGDRPRKDGGSTTSPQAQQRKEGKSRSEQPGGEKRDDRRRRRNKNRNPRNRNNKKN